MLKQPTLPDPKFPLERIAFAGPMCSGKTTLANFLVEDYHYNRVNFARLLKETAAKLYGAVSKDDEGRKLLQEFADDLKKWDPNLFTTHLLLDVQKFQRDVLPLVVLDDLRFKHEYDALKKNGFTIIGVHCQEDVRMERIRNLYPDTDPARFTHPSETGWKEMNMDYWVDNTDFGGQVWLDTLMESRYVAF